MNFSEKRKKWLTKKLILNTIHVSAGIFVIASVFQVAEIFISGSDTIGFRVLYAILAIAITILMFLISGLINPDFMDIVFRMLGFKEETETSPENSNKEKGEEIDQDNDFLQLANRFPNDVSQEDLRVLLKQRLEIPSKYLTSSATMSVSIIIGFLGVYYALQKALNVPFSNPVLVGVAIMMGIVFIILVFKIRQYAMGIKNREITIMRQYLEAIAELNRRNQE